MAIFIAVIIFVGIVIYGFSTSSAHSNNLSKEESDFEEERDGFI